MKEIYKKRVLRAFDVDELCDRIISGDVAEQGAPDWMEGMTFEPFVAKMSALYCDRVQASDFRLGSKCFSCPFYKTPSDAPEKRDGYMECWKEKAHFSELDFTRPLLTNLLGQKLLGREEEMELNQQFVGYAMVVTFVLDMKHIY